MNIRSTFGIDDRTGSRVSAPTAMTVPTAVIFDVDGTLVDNAYFNVVAWARACHDFNVPIDCARLHSLIGMGGDQLTQQLVGHQLRELDAAQGRYMQEFIAEVKPLGGGGDLIHTLDRRGMHVGIATSGAADTAKTYLRRVLDELSIVDSIVTRDDIEATKPAPDLIAVALQRSGVSPESALMIGDTRWDVEAAARCGVRTIALRSGGRSDAELRRAGAIAVYENVGELLENIASSPLADLSGTQRTKEEAPHD
jgi:HAD superfamily hydrolase (TIGR01509 family)